MKASERDMSGTKTETADNKAAETSATERPASPAKPGETRVVDQETQKDAAVDRAENGGYD